MARSENDELNGLEAISKMIGSGRSDPRSNFYNDILTGKDRGGGKAGNASKFIAGFMSSRRNSNLENSASAAMMQNQLKQMQRNMDAAMILQQHEKEGLGEDMTFKAMMQRYAMTGDDFYKNIATQFKPSARNVDPITMKKNYIVSKYGSIDNLDDSARGQMDKDPVIQHFDTQIQKYLGVNAPSAVQTTSQIEPNADDERMTSAVETSSKGGLSGIWDAMFGGQKPKATGRVMPEKQAASPMQEITTDNLVSTAVKNLKGKDQKQAFTILKNQVKAKRISQQQAKEIWDQL